MARRALVALAAAATLAAAPGHAQGAASTECTGLADPAAEIACLRQALEASRKAQAAAPAPAAALQAPAPSQTAPQDSPALGDEQLPRVAAPAAAEPPDPGAFRATITASRTDRRGLLVMQLDNGQIWRQAEGTDLPVRIDADERVRVEIARSGFGGYRMRFPDFGRRIAVSRLR